MFTTTPCTLGHYCWLNGPHLVRDCMPPSLRDAVIAQQPRPVPTVSSLAPVRHSVTPSPPGGYPTCSLPMITMPVPAPARPASSTSAVTTPAPLDQVPAASSDRATTKLAAPSSSRPTYSYEDVPPREVLLAQLEILRERSLELADAGCWLKRHYIMRNGFDCVDGKEWDGSDGLDVFLANVDQVLAPRFDISPAEYATLTGWIPRPEAAISRKKKLARRCEDITAADTAPIHSALVVESDTPGIEPAAAASDTTTTTASIPPITMMSHDFRPAPTVIAASTPHSPSKPSLESALTSDEDDEVGSESGSESDGSSLQTPTSTSPAHSTALPYPGLANGPAQKKPTKIKNPHLAEGLNLLPEHLDHFRRGSIMKFIKGGQHPRVLEHDARAHARREEHQRWFEERWKARMAEKTKFCSDEEQCVCGWGERVKGPRPIETKPHFGPRNMLPERLLPPSEVVPSVSHLTSTSSRRSKAPLKQFQAASNLASIRTIAPPTRLRSLSVAEAYDSCTLLGSPSPPLTPPKISPIVPADNSDTLLCNLPSARTFSPIPTPPRTPLVLSIDSNDHAIKPHQHPSAHSLPPAPRAASNVSHLRAKWELPSMVESLERRRSTPRPPMVIGSMSSRSESPVSVYSGTQASVYV